MKVISLYNERGRRPEDLKVIESHLNQKYSSWTGFAIGRFADFFGDRRMVSDLGRVLAGSGETPPSIELPTLEQYLDGDVDKMVFRKKLGHVYYQHFNRNIRWMARVTGLDQQDLLEYMHGISLPKNFDEVVRLAHGLKVDPFSLGYAWLSANWEDVIFINDNMESPERHRMELLVHAAARFTGHLGMRRVGSFDIPTAASLVHSAVSAGIDSDTAFDVTVRYARSYPHFFDDILKQRRNSQGMDLLDLRKFLIVLLLTMLTIRTPTIKSQRGWRQSMRLMLETFL